MPTAVGQGWRGERAGDTNIGYRCESIQSSCNFTRAGAASPAAAVGESMTSGTLPASRGVAWRLRLRGGHGFEAGQAGRERLQLGLLRRAARHTVSFCRHTGARS
eukprot:COSAG01_NODE_18921_length_1043_cov_1.549788_1_plen_105_part_00